MKDEILGAIAEQDSVGGVIEGYITGMPAGVGDPLFDSVESRLSALLFSVPAVKGVEFGDGFTAALTKPAPHSLLDIFRMAVPMPFTCRMSSNIMQKIRLQLNDLQISLDL